MGYRPGNEWLWVLPPSATYDEVDRCFRDLRNICRWQRLKDRLHWLPWT